MASEKFECSAPEGVHPKVAKHFQDYPPERLWYLLFDYNRRNLGPAGFDRAPPALQEGELDEHEVGYLASMFSGMNYVLGTIDTPLSLRYLEELQNAAVSGVTQEVNDIASAETTIERKHSEGYRDGGGAIFTGLVSMPLENPRRNATRAGLAELRDKIREGDGYFRIVFDKAEYHVGIDPSKLDKTDISDDAFYERICSGHKYDIYFLPELMNISMDYELVYGMPDGEPKENVIYIDEKGNYQVLGLGQKLYTGKLPANIDVSNLRMLLKEDAPEAIGKAASSGNSESRKAFVNKRRDKAALMRSILAFTSKEGHTLPKEGTLYVDAEGNYKVGALGGSGEIYEGELPPYLCENLESRLGDPAFMAAILDFTSQQGHTHSGGAFVIRFATGHAKILDRLSGVINEFNARMEQDLSEEDKIKAIAWCVREILLTHPFSDGNGRTISLLLNKLLLQHNLSPTIIENPTRIDGFSLDELCAEIKRGQDVFRDQRGYLPPVDKTIPSTEDGVLYLENNPNVAALLVYNAIHRIGPKWEQIPIQDRNRTVALFVKGLCANNHRLNSEQAKYAVHEIGAKTASAICSASAPSQFFYNRTYQIDFNKLDPDLSSANINRMGNPGSSSGFSPRH